MIESRKVHTSYNLQIRLEGLPQYGMAKQTAFGDVTHEQFDDDEEFVHGLEEAWSECGYWCTSNGLLKMCVRFSVRKLNCSDSADVI